MTQAQMAERLGISIRGLHNIEKGIVPARMSCAVLFRIEQEFGVAPAELFVPLGERAENASATPLMRKRFGNDECEAD